MGVLRFHPAVQRVKAILDSGELGAIKSLEAVMAIPKGIMADSDIRFDYPLGGGSLMDMGCKFCSSSGFEKFTNMTICVIHC